MTAVAAGAATRPARLPRPLLFLGLGALAGLGQAPTSVPFLLLAALVVVMRAPGGFWAGWAFNFGLLAVSLRWIVEPFLVDPETHGWMAPFGVLLLAGWQSSYGAVAFWLAKGRPLALVGLWAASEALRSFLFTGFPWALLGHGWIGTPLEQTVAWWGVHGLTLATLLLAWGIARLGWSPWQGLVPVALAGAWVALDPGPAPPADAGAPVVRLVQPNVPQAEKWDPLHQPEHLRRLLALSEGPPVDLVAWPETALTQLLADAGPVLAEAARRAGAPLATGVARAEDGDYFNSLALTDGAGAVVAVYDKHHLVPFGEFFPLSRWLGIEGLVGTGFTAGPGPAILPSPVGPLAVLICYESIFAHEVPRGARAILLVSNDAWFGDWAGPRQHLELGRLRAIETGMPILRAANTGVSALVDGRGRVLAELPLHRAGTIDARLPAALPTPPYGRTGDWPAFAAIALALLLGARRLDAGARRP